MRRRRPIPKPELSDEQVRAILAQAMADVEGDPALVYAFKKTGVYVCEENETTLPPDQLAAFQSAVDEYFRMLGGPVQ
jgi:hypothetical protein